jgi:hypothetical protein
MTLDEIIWLQDNTSKQLKTHVAADGTETPFVYGQVGPVLSIDGKVCIPVEATQQSFPEYAQIEILDRSGARLGLLCLTAGYELDLSSISNDFYMAYLTEISPDLYGEPYSMHYSYVIVDAATYQDYVDKYLNTAPLWGGFIHSTTPSSLVSAYKGAPQALVAIEDLSFTTPYHSESVLRSVVQPFAFERYLKLYHLLELRFDYDVVERVRALGNDLKGIGQIFSDYGHKELLRLRSTVESGITDIGALEARINGVKHCSDCEEVARNIFFRYGKDGNPLKEKEAEYELIMAQGGFSKTLASSHGLIGGAGTALDERYRKLLTDLATYWIYRVRSSIAHSRIGEYVMTSSDEEFVVEVAEPLLREVMVQIFSP